MDHTAAGEINARACLLEALSCEYSLIDQVEGALKARETALELRRRRGNLLKTGDNLRWLSRLAWLCGRGEDARRLARQAIEVLEPLPPGPELATAYSTMAQLHMHSEDCLDAIDWGERALDLAEKLGLADIAVNTLNNIGLAESLMGKPEGTARLARALPGESPSRA